MIVVVIEQFDYGLF